VQSRERIRHAVARCAQALSARTHAVTARARCRSRSSRTCSIRSRRA
jgi:hypothetical protein